MELRLSSVIVISLIISSISQVVKLQQNKLNKLNFHPLLLSNFARPFGVCIMRQYDYTVGLSAVVVATMS